MISWIRLYPKNINIKVISNMWNALVKSFVVIGGWCAWKVENGKHFLLVLTLGVELIKIGNFQKILFNL